MRTGQPARIARALTRPGPRSAIRRFSRACRCALALITTFTLAADTAADTVAVNGIELYYEVHGDGEPLLLIHGGLGHGEYWSRQTAVLARDYRVIVVDSRGHGRSTFTDEPISYRLMASDLRALLDHLDVRAAHLVGWSDGGILGLELAIHHPERLLRVVAYGANFHPGGVKPDVMANPTFARFVERAAADYQRLSPAPERWQAFLANIGQMWGSQPDYSRAQLAGISVPVLVLAGLGEEAVFVDHMRELHRRIPGSELQVMEGTGHFAMWDRPQAFNDIVLEFLRR